MSILIKIFMGEIPLAEETVTTVKALELANNWNWGIKQFSHPDIGIWFFSTEGERLYPIFSFKEDRAMQFTNDKNLPINEAEGVVL